MAEVGRLLVRLMGDDTHLERTLDSGERAVEAFAADTERQMNRVDRAFRRGEAGSRALLLGVTALGAAITATGFVAVKKAAEFEQVGIAFETLLGSGERAESFLQRLERFAARTPFELPGLVDASRKLLAFGFNAEDVIPTMTAVGNAVSALGGGQQEIAQVVRALGQMRAKGKVSAEEMLQLTETGLPAWEFLAEAIGMSIPQAMDLASQGSIPAAKAIEGILDRMNRRFEGAMEKQSQTILGRWSATKDNLDRILRGIGKSLVETFDIGDALARLNERLDEFATLIEQRGLRGALEEVFPPGTDAVIVAIAGAITGALVPALWAVAKAIWAMMIPLWPFMLIGAAVAVTAWLILKNWERIPAFFEAAWRYMAGAAKWAVAQIVGAVGGLVQIFSYVIPGLRSTADAITAYAKSLQAAAQEQFALAHAALATHEAEQAADGLAGAGEEAAQQQQAMADALEAAGKAANKNLQSFDEVHQLEESMAGAAQAVADAMAGAGVTLPELPEPPEVPGDQGHSSFPPFPPIPPIDTSPILALAVAVEETEQRTKGAIDRIIGHISNLRTAIIQGFSDLPDKVDMTGQRILVTTSNAWVAVSSETTSHWASLTQWLNTTWLNIHKTAWNRWNGINATITDWWGVTRGNTMQVWTGLTTWLGQQWFNIHKTAWNRWNGINATITDWWEYTRFRTEEIWTGAVAWLDATWQGLWVTAYDKWAGMSQSIEGWTDWTAGRLAEQWTAAEKHLAELWEGIRQTAADKWNAIADSIESAADRAQRAIEALLDAQKTAQRIAESVGGMTGTTAGGTSDTSGTSTTNIGGVVIQLPNTVISPTGPSLSDLVGPDNIPGLARGGTTLSPGLVMVGEEGPELLNLPRGATVAPLGGGGDLAAEIGEVVGNVVMDGIRILLAGMRSANTQQMEGDVILGDERVGRVMWRLLEREAQRRGLRLAVREA